MKQGETEVFANLGTSASFFFRLERLAAVAVEWVSERVFLGLGFY